MGSKAGKAKTRTSTAARIKVGRRGLRCAMRDLTPNPFPLGKGNQSGSLFIAVSRISVASLAFFCERSWPARFSRWLRCENRAGLMRAGGRPRPTVVEHHQLSRLGSAGIPRLDIDSTPPASTRCFLSGSPSLKGRGAGLGRIGGTPPPGAQRARLSPVWHSCRPTTERLLRQPPSLTSERGDIGEGARMAPVLSVPSLAFFCERRWLARWPLFTFCDRRASRMRAGRAARPVVEHHQLSRIRSAGISRLDIANTSPASTRCFLSDSPSLKGGGWGLGRIGGTPPPGARRARLSPVWHSCRQTAERQLRQLPLSLVREGTTGTGRGWRPDSPSSRSAWSCS